LPFNKGVLWYGNKTDQAIKMAAVSVTMFERFVGNPLRLDQLSQTSDNIGCEYFIARLQRTVASAERQP
jgi:hypothetical protein